MKNNTSALTFISISNIRKSFAYFILISRMTNIISTFSFDSPILESSLVHRSLPFVRAAKTGWKPVK